VTDQNDSRKGPSSAEMAEHLLSITEAAAALLLVGVPVTAEGNCMYCCRGADRSVAKGQHCDCCAWNLLRQRVSAAGHRVLEDVKMRKKKKPDYGPLEAVIRHAEKKAD
jgi:hypothetical protein